MIAAGLGYTEFLCGYLHCCLLESLLKRYRQQMTVNWKITTKGFVGTGCLPTANVARSVMQ